MITHDDTGATFSSDFHHNNIQSFILSQNKQTKNQKLENSASITVMVKVIFQQEEKSFVFMGFCVVLVFYFLLYFLVCLNSCSNIHQAKTG